tara:strand:+ start:14844 stop:15842 length:999 start_codon:yes stop_codon:yes gene_type:complete
MSSGNNIRKSMDSSVIYMFIGVFLISAVTLAFRYSKYAPCDEVLFSTDAREFRAGEMIKFRDKTEGAEIWTWDFGDGTTGSYQKDPLHIFKEEGEYKVRLLVNNTCERIETVVIKEKRVLIDSTKFPVFSLPESITVGETLKVKDETNNADTWEWRFGETASINATSKNAEYVYEEPGLKTVSLVVNGDLNYITKKKINVIPKKGEKVRITEIEIPKREPGWNIKSKPSEVVSQKEEAASKPSVTPYINESNFGLKVLLVSQEKTTPQAFSEFFCGNINIPIVVNGKNTTFLVFCEKIKGKKIKIKSLNLFREKGSNCIKNVTIDYKKSGLF